MVPRGAPAAAGALAFAAVGALAAANGGYFPTEWGWAIAGLALVVSSAALLRGWIALGRLRLAALGGLAAFAAWTGASAAWAVVGAAHPVLETERVLVYVCALAAFLLVAGAAEAEWLLVGTWAALTVVAAYALATRLFPDRLGSYGEVDSYQLAEPFGYWNALGVAAVLGILLAAGLAAHAGRAELRAAAGFSLGVLAPTLYFTFSRGSWAALGAGLIALAALDPRRVRLTVSLAAILLPVAPGIWLCSGQEALTKAGTPLGAAAHAGHRLAPVLILLAALAGGAAVLAARVRLAPRLARAVTIALAATGLVIVAGAAAAAPRAIDSFKAPLPSTGGDLNRRLLNASGNGRADYWRAAWHEVREHPLVGGGAGSYERYWLRDRPTAFPARNAHNLYLETLAELGPLGLLLLAGTLALPLWALRRARARPLAAAAGAAYVAFLVHAAVDWDWQITALGVAALACAASLLAWGDDEDVRVEARGRAAAVAAAIVLALAGVAAQIGNAAVDASLVAGDRLQPRRAERDARRAIRWQPWSHEGWQRLAEAQVSVGDVDAARRSLHEAIARDAASWELWYLLATVSDGPARDAAIAHARALNPKSPEIGVLVG